MDALASELALESSLPYPSDVAKPHRHFHGSWASALSSAHLHDIDLTSEPFLQPEIFLTKFDFRQFYICAKYTSSTLTPNLPTTPVTTPLLPTNLSHS